MISIDVLFAQVAGLQRPDLERWIDNAWVRPEQMAGGYVFHEIDVARIRLIQALRDEMEVNESALPIVLSLLDQLYDLRRRIQELGDALCHTAPGEVRRQLAAHLANPDMP